MTNVKPICYRRDESKRYINDVKKIRILQIGFHRERFLYKLFLINTIDLLNHILKKIHNYIFVIYLKDKSVRNSMTLVRRSANLIE